MNHISTLTEKFFFHTVKLILIRYFIEPNRIKVLLFQCVNNKINY